MKNAIAITAASVFLALITAALSTLLYFFVLEKPWLTYENIPFPPTIETVHPGDVMPLQVVRCNHDLVSHTYNLSHSLYEVNTHVYTLLPGVSAMISPGCADSISQLNRVPENTPPGRYILFGASEIDGTMRKFSVDWHSQEFNIEAAK